MPDGVYKSPHMAKQKVTLPKKRVADRKSGVCQAEGCELPSEVQYMCDKHAKIAAALDPCSSPNCDRAVFANRLCYAHYRRQSRGGNATAPLEWRVGLIPLPSTKVPPAVALQFEQTARAQGISQFELLRRLVLKWYSETTGQNVDPS